MAGISKYEKNTKEELEGKLTFENENNSYEDVSMKFGKEAMDASELAVYLSKQRGLENGPLNEKTIRRYITRLCEMSHGMLKESDFKDGRAYKFQPGYHDLLMTLLDTDYFGGKKNENKLSDRIVLHEQVANNINKYLETEIQKKVKEDPSYLNARLESRLSELFENELAGMVHTMYNAESVVQYQFIIEAIDRIVALRRWMNEWEERMQLIRCEFAKGNEEKTNAKLQQGAFKNDSIETLIIKMLAAKVSGKEYQYVMEDEELSYPAVYVSLQLYDIRGRSDHELNEIFTEMERNVSNDKRYQMIMDIASRFFGDNAYLSDKVLTSFSKVLKSQLVVNSCDLNANDYEKVVRFVENAFVRKKEDIYRVLDSKVKVRLDKETLGEILAIKDREEKRGVT